MGTNYYWTEEGGDRVHIGKSSVGWCFGLHVTDDIQSLDDWKVQWTRPGRIEDEYSKRLSSTEMLVIITERGREDPIGWDEHMLSMNHHLLVSTRIAA